MTYPASTAKVVLLADRPPTPTEPGVPPVRRYRLARLRFDTRREEPEARFEHLKRAYD
jgi:hypothetical protein